MKHRSLVLALALFGACASGGAEEMAPTPYTAEAIRAHNPQGTELYFVVQQEDMAAVMHTMRFVRTDAEIACFDLAKPVVKKVNR